MTSAAAKVLNIPELSEMILQGLSLHDFAQCILVNRSFSELFTPILWHTISLCREDQHALFISSPDVRTALVKNVHYIQVIQVRTCKGLIPFLSLDSKSMVQLHTVQFPWYNTNLVRLETDELLLDPMLVERRQWHVDDDNNGFTSRYEIDMSSASVPTPTGDWLRYNGMFLMRRFRFIDRLYRHRRPYESLRQPVKVQQQQKGPYRNQTEYAHFEADKQYTANKIKESESRLWRLEREFSMQENSLRNAIAGTNTPQLEQELACLKDNIEVAKKEIESWKQRSSSLVPTYLLDTGSNINLDSFNVRYEPADDYILEQFLYRFAPRLEVLTSSTLPFLHRGIIQSIVQLENLRYLSLAIFRAQLKGQISNVNALLMACPPQLEILRLSFLGKDAGIDGMNGITSTMGMNSSAQMTESPLANTVDNDDDTVDKSPDIVQLSILRSGPIRSLRRLFIEGSLGNSEVNSDVDTIDISPDLHTWIAFLKRCPNLLTLSLGDCSVVAFPEIGHCLKAYCTKLEDLVLGRIQMDVPSVTVLDPIMAMLLSSLTGLKRLRIDTFTFLSNSQVLDVLQTRFAETLTDVSLNDCKYSQLSYKEVQHAIFPFLASLKNVESLDLFPSGEIFHPSDFFFAGHRFVKEFMAAPWMCQRTLRVLRIGFDSIMRKAHRFSQTAERDLENSRKWQREICHILGEFTALEELSLGVLATNVRSRIHRSHKKKDGHPAAIGAWNYSPTPPTPEDHEQGPVYGAFKFVGIQSECLALSLTHGLEFMGGLKRLRVLNVARMDHLIGIKEIEFMLENWPKLEFLPGLLKGPWYQGNHSYSEQERINLAGNVERQDAMMVEWIKMRCPSLKYN